MKEVDFSSSKKFREMNKKSTSKGKNKKETQSVNGGSSEFDINIVYNDKDLDSINHEGLSISVEEYV